MRDQAIRLAVLRALKDRIKQADNDTLATFADDMDSGDSKAATLDDGTPLGKVYKSKGKTTPTVTDEAALLAWVRANHPDEIEETIRPAYRTALLETAKRYGEPVDETSGEIVPGIELRHGEPYVGFRGEKGYGETVAARWSELSPLALPELETGHE